MYQRWRFLTFLHWRYDPSAIEKLLPSQVTLDTFDGSAWIGLTPFLLTDLRPPFLPSLPHISHFPETNVRTYVRGPDGERGVWFFTLEADRLAAVMGARLLYRLPYRWAAMRVTVSDTAIQYRSARKRLFGSAQTRIEVAPGDRLSVSDFDNFLTARYRLYTLVGRRLGYAQIDHEPWPLQTGRLVGLDQNLIERSGVPAPAGAPILHYSADLTVRIGRLRLAEPS